MQGYFKNPAATAAVMREDGWVDTGDLGYLADGELFVTARIKDVIIMGGRNLYPQEVEEVVGEVPGVRRGCVAAFGVSDQRLGTEKLVVIAETRETDRVLQDEIEARIIACVDAHLGLPPDVVRLVAPQRVPKTSSGKIRRDACKQLYLREELATKPLPPWVQVLRLALGNAGNRMRQAVSRCVHTIYGIYSWLALAVVMLPGWILVMVLPSGRDGHKARNAFGSLCRAALFLAGLKPRISGREFLAEARATCSGRAAALGGFEPRQLPGRPRCGGRISGSDLFCLEERSLDVAGRRHLYSQVPVSDREPSRCFASGGRQPGNCAEAAVR